MSCRSLCEWDRKQSCLRTRDILGDWQIPLGSEFTTHINVPIANRKRLGERAEPTLTVALTGIGILIFPDVMHIFYNDLIRNTICIQYLKMPNAFSKSRKMSLTCYV